MRMIVLALPLLALAACETYPNEPYGQGGYGQEPYGYPEPAPYPPTYPGPGPQPYPPYPQPGYPDTGYPQSGYPDPNYSQPDYPVPAAEGMFNLAGTNWRVVSIDGRTVPAGYTLNFTADRMSGRLGCNSLGAGYRVSGNLLTAGAIVMTRMACANMADEARGAAIMAQPMTLSEDAGRMTLSNRIGAIGLQRAR